MVTPVGRALAGGSDVVIRRSSAADWAAIGEFRKRRLAAARRAPYYPSDLLASLDLSLAAGAPGGIFIVEVSPAPGSAYVIECLASWHPLSSTSRGVASLSTSEAWAFSGLGTILVATAAWDAIQAGTTAFLVPLIPRNGALRAAARDAGLRERRASDLGPAAVELVLQGYGGVPIAGAAARA